MDILRAGDMRKRVDDAHNDLIAVKELLKKQCELLQQIIDTLNQPR